MSGKIAILIDATLHNELVLRLRKTDDVTTYIEHAVETFLERTKHADDLWSPQFIDEIAEIEGDQKLSRYGDPKKGFRWQLVFLPNGTQLKMPYKGRDHFAEIQHERLIADGTSHSPSEWASRVAGNTSRNAWRDIWVLLPGSDNWQLADVLRRSSREAIVASLRNVKP
jgi:hypothetical protein